MEFDEMRKKMDISFVVDSRRFRILKLSGVPEFSDGIFSITKDRNEVTVVASEEADLVETQDEEKYLRLLTIDAVLPFSLTGFLAHLSGVLAKEKIPIFVISTYSTDHIFVKEAFLDRAIEALERNGIMQAKTGMTGVGEALAENAKKV